MWMKTIYIWKKVFDPLMQFLYFPVYAQTTIRSPIRLLTLVVISNYIKGPMRSKCKKSWICSSWLKLIENILYNNKQYLKNH